MPETAPMEKEAFAPLIAAGVAAALPFLGALRHNPTGRYNVGGQRFQNYADLEAAAQPGDVIVETPLTGRLKDYQDWQPGVVTGHADIVFQDPHTEELSNIFLPMRPKTLRKSYQADAPAGPTDFKVQDFSLLRPKGTPEQRAAVASALANYGAKAHEFRAAVQDQLAQVPALAGNQEAQDTIANALRLSFSSNPNYRAIVRDELFGLGPGAGQAGKDPLVQRTAQNIAKVQDPAEFARELVGKLDFSNPTREGMKPQLEALSAQVCGAGRCSTSPAYFTNQFGGGTRINKPLDYIAPRDYLYARNLEPVGHYIANPATPSPTSILQDPQMKMRALIGAGMGAGTLAAYGLGGFISRLFQPKVPWYTRLGRALKAGDFKTATTAMREGAHMAMRKLGLVAPR